MNAQLVGLQAEVLACQARVLGMQAENAHRAACGESPAYREDAFVNESNHMVWLAGCAQEFA